MPFNVALIEPEIPQNTGNIIRLCANTGARLHLVEPLGFGLGEKQLRRASLDYSHIADVEIHDSVKSFLGSIDLDRVFITTTSGATTYDHIAYQDGDTVVFGSESQGLPDALVAELPVSNQISIPMMPSNRSLNLSNAVALVIYEMWRQQSFTGSENPKQNTPKYFS